MDLTSTIGRDLLNPSGYDINVSNNYAKVSHSHVTIHWHGINNGKEGVVILEDHDTPNGTFVNGRRYVRVRLNETDKVRLGGDTKNDYQLDLKKLYASFKKAELSNRTDFSEEFESVIKKAYDDYTKDVLKIKKRLSISGKIPQIIANIAAYGISFLISLRWQKVGSLGYVLSGVFSVFTLSQTVRISDKQEREIAKLQLKYQSKYCCPKCGVHFDFNSKTWAKLDTYGHCLNPKCDAVFKKPETK